MLPKRLREQREKKQMTQSELGKMLGVERATVSRYETGDREPDSEVIRRLAGFFGVSVDYLLGQTDDPRPAQKIREQQAEYLAHLLGDQLVSPDEMTELPIIGRIAAGEPIYADQNIEGKEMVLKTDIAGGEYFWLRVRGDSMADKIADGDLVLVRKQTTLENGQIGVVLVNGDEATIKRVYLNGDQCMLVPDNATYQPQVYPASEVIVIGEVVRSMHSHNGR